MRLFVALREDFRTRRGEVCLFVTLREDFRTRRGELCLLIALREDFRTRRGEREDFRIRRGEREDFRIRCDDLSTVPVHLLCTRRGEVARISARYFFIGPLDFPGQCF